MKFIRARFDRGLWVALLASAGLAFAPTVSRMVLPSQEHCATAAPMVGHDMASMASSVPQLAESGTDAKHASHAPATLEHCDLCAVAALACAVTPTLPSLEAGAVSHAEPAHPPNAASARRIEWSPATWRGPPATA